MAPSAGRGPSARADGPATGTGEADGPESDPTPEAERERAREYLLRALTSSAKSRTRLADGLSRRGIAPEIADEVLARFEEVGLIDDPQYAQTLVRTRFAERGLSRRALATELRRHGIAAHAAEEALAQIDGDDELAAARRLAATRAARSVGLPAETRRRRLAAMLGRKGYSSDIVMQVVREALADDA